MVLMVYREQPQGRFIQIWLGNRIAVLTVTGLLAACGGSVEGQDVVTSAIVTKAEEITHRAYGSWWTEYFLRLEGASPEELRYLYISGKKIDKKDLARTIGERVDIKCHMQNPKAYCYATSYQFQGRELIQATK
jgi:hypothetical protein